MLSSKKISVSNTSLPNDLIKEDVKDDPFFTKCDGYGPQIRDIGLARGWIHHYNTEAKVKVRELNELAWNYDTNITDDNQKKQVSTLVL